MKTQDLDLKTILDIPMFEHLQDALAKATGTAIVTIDYKGTPVTKHSYRTEFCSVIRENPVSRKRCTKCDALAGLEAVRLNRPYIYLCHCGIVDVAVPVMVGDKYLGAVMFGQVRIPNGDTDAKVERLVSEISSFQAEEETTRHDLLEKYEKIPEMEYKRIVEIAELIDAAVQYIVHRAVENRNKTLTYEWMLRSVSAGTVETRLPDIGKMAEFKEPEDRQQPDGLSKSSPVYPAVSYVENHRGEMVSMRDMANLCHLSPGYFSKIFPREAGETFTDYVNRRKVEWAKQKLRDSAESVSSIAFELGYVDTSYFIKVFKKFEGITPLAYRQQRYKA